jgi:hypothetical protein
MVVVGEVNSFFPAGSPGANLRAAAATPGTFISSFKNTDTNTAINKIDAETYTTNIGTNYEDMSKRVACAGPLPRCC